MIAGLVEAASALWEDDRAAVARVEAALAALGARRLEHLRRDMLSALLGELEDGADRLGRLAQAEAAPRRRLRLRPGDPGPTLGLMNRCTPPTPRKVREAHGAAANCVAYCEARGFKFPAARMRLRQARSALARSGGASLPTSCAAHLGGAEGPRRVQELASSNQIRPIRLGVEVSRGAARGRGALRQPDAARRRRQHVQAGNDARVLALRARIGGDAALRRVPGAKRVLLLPSVPGRGVAGAQGRVQARAGRRARRGGARAVVVRLW